MNSRERTFAALAHEEGDRIPIDFWASKGLRHKISTRAGLSFEAFLDKYDVDLRYIEGPEYTGPALGEGTDIWGVARRVVRVETPDGPEWYREAVGSPLAAATSAAEVAAYPHWPSPDDYRYDVVESQCDAVLSKGRVAVFMGDRLNRFAQLKPAMYLRGMEQIYVDMATAGEVAKAIFGQIRAFYREYLRRILEAAQGKIDIILTGDDFGAQNGPLVAPEMWDGFLREGFAEYIAIIHEFGARAMHHTCGSVVDLIPRMIDCGLDILQSLQPEAAGMDPARLKADFGGRLSFQGGVSIQRTLPFGSRDDVRREVKRLAATLGPSGGYIFGTAHNVQADTPLENVEALLGAYHDYGRY